MAATQWTVPMRLSFDVYVTVEAETEEQALAKAATADWVDDGLASGDMCDWSFQGAAKLSYKDASSQRERSAT